MAERDSVHAAVVPDDGDDDVSGGGGVYRQLVSVKI